MSTVTTPRGIPVPADPTLESLAVRWYYPSRYPYETEQDRQRATRMLAAALLTASLGARVDAAGTMLYVHSHAWSADAGRRADQLKDPDYETYKAALGVPETVLLSSDHFGADTTRWCPHNPPAGAWAYYERWTVEGRTAHGWVHAAQSCRRLTQSG